MESQPIDHRVVRFSPPAIGDDEIREVVDTLQSDWITTGPKVALFEKRFRDFVGAPAALALNSCTAGLHLSLVTLGIGPGDEVITSTLTFASTVNVIEHVGARPVLVDVEPDTLNLDSHRVAAAITSRTKAIIVVHFAGHPADLDALAALAQTHGIALVEDAAHALPAAYRGRRVGSSANLTSFSFYATKNLTTAEGGMLTGDAELVERARILSLHGMSRNAWNRYGADGTWFYDVVCPGFKYNMTDLQAALGLAQLGRLETLQ
jgi:dTDP-4-amino-4,6-dideoxygalactose transaminase